MPGMQVGKFHHKGTESTKIEVKGDLADSWKVGQEFSAGLFKLMPPGAAYQSPITFHPLRVLCVFVVKLLLNSSLQICNCFVA
jgi:hypothetical protein